MSFCLPLHYQRYVTQEMDVTEDLDSLRDAKRAQKRNPGTKFQLCLSNGGIPYIRLMEPYTVEQAKKEFESREKLMRDIEEMESNPSSHKPFDINKVDPAVRERLARLWKEVTRQG